MNSPFLDGRKKIFENDVGFVIEDIFAVSKGHMLVVPHREYPDYFQSTPKEFAHTTFDIHEKNLHIVRN